jgi:hypothetical protein
MNVITTNQSSADSLLAKMFDAEMQFMRGPSDDLSLLATAFDPGVAIHEPQSLPYGGEWVGLESLGQLFRTMGEIWDSMQVSDMIAARTGDTVLMSCRISMTSRATGRTINQPFAERLIFRDGRLLEGTPFYFDTAAILGALA